MQHVKKAIERAIEGGFSGKNSLGMKVPVKEIRRFFSMPSIQAKMFLDPEFWQALGVSSGFKEREDLRNKAIERSGGISYTDNGINNTIWYYSLQLWHKFIDALASGKTPDEFFKEILK